MSFLLGLAYILLLLLGWWLPAVLFYVMGLVLLLRAGRRPLLAAAWSITFLASLAYTLRDGIEVKRQFEQRAETFKSPVSYAHPPDDVRTILTSVQEAGGSLANGQGCDVGCVRLLVSGRFDKVIIAYRDPLRVHSEPNPKRLYRTHAIVTQTGCMTSPSEWSVYPSLWFWQHQCITDTESDAIGGRRFVVIEDQADDSTSPPWPISLSYIELVDGDQITPIARAETATFAEFTYPFPVPGFFPHGQTNGFPTDWRPGFLSFQHSYGQSIQSWKFVGQVFGVDMYRVFPKPDDGSQPGPG